MVHLARSGCCLLALAGAGYAIWILWDCCNQAFTKGDGSTSTRRTSRIDWLSQIAAAVILLAVVIPMLILSDKPKIGGDRDEKTDKLALVKIEGLPDLPRNRLYYTSIQAGSTLEGADLIDLPLGDTEVRALLKYGPSIQWLNLTGSKITDNILGDLARMPSLVGLNLARTAITDAGFAELANAERLETLCFKKTAITDAGLACLVDLPNLRNIDMRHTTVTDAGIKTLRKMPQLQQVFLTGAEGNVVRLRDEL